MGECLDLMSPEKSHEKKQKVQIDYWVIKHILNEPPSWFPIAAIDFSHLAKAKIAPKLAKSYNHDQNHFWKWSGYIPN